MARTEEHFIWTGDYAERLDRLAAAAKAAEADRGNELLAGEADPHEQLQAEWSALRDEADAAGLRLTVRGLRDDEWDDVADSHPPRTEEPYAEGDKALGFNERTGTRPLIMAGLVEPAFETRSRFDDWVAENQISRGDLVALMMRIWRLTNGVSTTDPKLLQLSRTRVDAQS